MMGIEKIKSWAREAQSSSCNKQCYVEVIVTEVV